MTQENKIFNILHTEWSNGWGGQEQRIVLECKKMMGLGHKVVIACQPGSGILEKAKEAGIPVEEIRMRSGHDIRAIFGLKALIAKHNIDVVNTHSGKDNWVGSFAAKLAGVDLLVRTRHLSVPISQSPLNFVHKMADGIITTGTAIRETMIRDNGIVPEKIESIATGVNLERFDHTMDGSEVRRELGISEKAPVVSMVAVLRSMKRHDLLIEAAALLKDRFPDVKFLIVGEGPTRESIEKLIADKGLASSIIMTGYRDDVPKVLASSDIAVLTSDKFEGVPQSLSQAMAMGKPVVAAPVGSTEELVLDKKTGILAELGSADSFAEGIGRLLEDAGMRERMGTAAREHILKGYTDDIMAEKTVACYLRWLNRLL